MRYCVFCFLFQAIWWASVQLYITVLKIYSATFVLDFIKVSHNLTNTVEKLKGVLLLAHTV